MARLPAPRRHAPFQILLFDPNGDPVALGHTIPFVWDGTLEDLPNRLDGEDGVMAQAMEDHRDGRVPNAPSALAAIVAPEHRRRGLSAEILRGMRSLAAGRGMHSLVAPVRPTKKSLYPLTSIERYARWKRDDGSPFDPWLRVHHGLGAEYLKAAPEALTVNGTAAEWEDWTDMRFPESGRYVVRGALEPVSIDRERDEGRCKDPNIWMRHPVR